MHVTWEERAKAEKEAALRQQAIVQGFGLSGLAYHLAHAIHTPEGRVYQEGKRRLVAY